MEKPLSLTSFHCRLLSGCILGPLTLAVIALGNWYFMALMMLAAGVALHEWYGLVKNGKDNYRYMILGGFYIAVSFISFVFLRMGFLAGGWLTLAVILCVWASDTGAYVIGKKWGRHKLAPKISPNKTREGFFAAMFFSGLVLMIMTGLGPYAEEWIETEIGLRQQHVWWVFAAGCVLGAVGQAGDLLISVFKRRANVKDTGNIIPGHGGLLDRIDSLLLVSPVFLAMLILWKN